MFVITDLKRKQRCRGISLIISGAIFTVIGFFVGHSIIPKAIIKRTADKICVDSKQHSGYTKWVSLFLAIFSRDFILLSLPFPEIFWHFRFSFSAELLP